MKKKRASAVSESASNKSKPVPQMSKPSVCDDGNESLPKPVWALTNFLESASKIGAIAVAIAAVAYALGLLQLWAYLRELGAPWTLAMFSALAIAQESSVSLAFAGGGFVLSVNALIQAEKPIRNFRWRESFFCGLAFVFMMIGEYGQSWASDYFRLRSEIYSAYCWATASGVVFASAIAEMSADGRLWRRSTLSHVAVATFFMIGWVPQQLGKAHGKLDARSATSELSKVDIDKASGLDWRIAAVTEKGILLMALGEKAQDRRFRVVDGKDLLEIRPVHVEGTVSKL